VLPPDSKSISEKWGVNGDEIIDFSKISKLRTLNFTRM
jgi:hypothetical protein